MIENQMGNRAALSREQLFALQERVLPTAYRWLNIPELASHARKTLAYWGEDVPEPKR